MKFLSSLDNVIKIGPLILFAFFFP